MIDRAHQIGCPAFRANTECTCAATPLFDLLAKDDGLWLVLNGARYRAAINLFSVDVVMKPGLMGAAAIREVYEMLRAPAVKRARVRYRGDKTVFLEQVRWGANDDPRGVLKDGKVYTLARREVHTWHTKYHLEEVPWKKFNSVHFEHVEEG
jgi:hypothetical protein